MHNQSDSHPFRTQDRAAEPVTDVRQPGAAREAMLQSLQGGELHVRPLMDLKASGRFARFVDVGLALRRALRDPAQRGYLIARLKPHLRYVIGTLPASIQRHGMLPPDGPEAPPLRLEEVGEAELQQWLVDDGSLIYGEMKRYELENYFDAIAPFVAPGGRMIDLGSGLGKVVMTAALTMPFAHCAGVELMGYRHAMAQQRLERMLAAGAPGMAPQEAQALRARIDFREGDMFQADVGDASLVFIYSTCFAPLMDALAAKLAREMRQGALVSCTTFPLQNPAFQLLRHYPPNTVAWTSVFLYRRWGDAADAPAAPACLYAPDADEWEARARAEFAAYDAA